MTTKRTPLLRRLVQYFLAGVFAILPLVVTVLIVAWVAGFLKGLIGPTTFLGQAISQLGLAAEGSGNTLLAYVVGWAVVLGAIFVLGFFVEHGARRLYQGTVDRLLTRLPLLGGIYKTTKQLVGMMDKQQSSEFEGMSVVYCLFGAASGAGVLALLVTPEVFQVGGRAFQIIMVPTAPVPFGGALLFVPKESVHPAGMSVEGLMSIYVSMGVTAGKFMQPEAKGSK